MGIGPVQLLVVGFDRPDFSGEVLAELERLRATEMVRVIDLLVVHKNAEGVVERVQRPGAAGEAEGAGDVVGALIGLEAGDGGPVTAEQDVWSLDDAIPNDSAAVIALVEHPWAIGVRDAIRAAGGVSVSDAWIHPDDLVGAGLTEADDVALPDG